MAITPLPSAPLPTDTTAQFNTKAFAWVAALDNFTTEANALATATNTNEVNAETAEANAEAAQAAAEAAQLAAETAQTAAELAETNAETAATAAVNAKNAAEAAWDAFDDKYLGAKSSDPTVDNDGNPLQNGAFYVNTTTGYIRVYPNSSIGWVQGISATAGVESINGQQGAVTGVLFDSDIGSDIQAYDSNLTSFVNTFTLPTTDGTANQVLATNGSGTLGFQTVSSISSNKVNMTLSKNMSAGDVAMIKSDGTIENIFETIASQLPYGSGATFETNGIYDVYEIAFDPFNSNKFIVAYRAQPAGYYGKLVVGQISGSTITYGTVYTFNSQSTSVPKIVFDPNNQNKFIVTYADYNASSFINAIVGTISGTSVTFGSSSVIYNSSATPEGISFDKLGGNKFAVSCRNSNDGYAYLSIATISGTSISGSTTTLFSTTGNASSCKVAFDPNVSNSLIVGYCDSSSSSYAAYKIGTVSGTSVSFGSQFTTTIVSGSPQLEFSPTVSGEFLSGGGTYLTVGTKSGSTLSFGTSSPAFTSSINFAQYIPNQANRICAFGRNGTSLAIQTANISGTSIPTVGGQLTYATSAENPRSSGFLANSSTFITAYYVSSSNHSCIAGIVGDSNYAAASVIGVLQESGTTGQSKPVSIKSGVDSTRSGLTVGSVYYVQADGSVSTTSTSPAQKLGRAISSTSIALQSTLWEV